MYVYMYPINIPNKVISYRGSVKCETKRNDVYGFGWLPWLFGDGVEGPGTGVRGEWAVHVVICLRLDPRVKGWHVEKQFITEFWLHSSSLRKTFKFLISVCPPFIQQDLRDSRLRYICPLGIIQLIHDKISVRRYPKNVTCKIPLPLCLIPNDLRGPGKETLS